MGRRRELLGRRLRLVLSSVHNPNFDVAERDCKLTGRLRRENYDSADDDAPHVAYIKSTPNPKSKANLDDVKGVGGVFMMLLEVRNSA